MGEQYAKGKEETVFHVPYKHLWSFLTSFQFVIGKQWLAVRVFQAVVRRIDEVDKGLAHVPGAIIGGHYLLKTPVLFP